MPVTELDTTSWAAFQSTLALRLGQLGNDDFITVAEGSLVPDPIPKRGPLGRLFGRKPAADAVAFVQAHRADQLVYVECVGSRSFGGRHAWTPEQESALTSIGWVHRPDLIGDKVYIMATVADPDLNGHIPVVEVRRAASLMVATLRDVVGVAEPVSLDVRLG